MPSAHELIRTAGQPGLSASRLDAEAEHFSRLTTAANEAFDRDDPAAHARYADALAEAERLFEAALEGGSPFVAPMALTIACHNASEAMRRAGDRVAARELGLRAADTLVRTAETATAPLALRVNCLRHLRHAIAFMVKSVGDGYGPAPHEIERLVARCRAVNGAVSRLLAHIASGAADGDCPTPDRTH